MRTKKQTEAIIKRATFLRRLLKENGLVLGAFDPGVQAYMKLGKDLDGRERFATVNLERQEWAWLEPILLELRKLRRQNKRKPHLRMLTHND